MCKNAGRCINVGSSHQCQCQPGYTGSYCEEMVDECKSNPCSNGATCKDYQGTYECVVSTNICFLFFFRFGQNCQKLPVAIQCINKILDLFFNFCSANPVTRESTVSTMWMNVTLNPV